MEKYKTYFSKQLKLTLEGSFIRRNGDDSVSYSIKTIPYKALGIKNSDGILSTKYKGKKLIYPITKTKFETYLKKYLKLILRQQNADNVEDINDASMNLEKYGFKIEGTKLVDVYTNQQILRDAFRLKDNKKAYKKMNLETTQYGHLYHINKNKKIWMNITKDEFKNLILFNSIEGIEITTKDFENITTADVSPVNKYIEEVLKNKDSNLLCHITIDVDYTRNEELYETKKAFDAELVKNRALTIIDFSQWADKYNGADTAYSANISRIEIKLVSKPSGGCQSKEVKIKDDKFELFSPSSTNNNCFFKCVKEHLKHETDMNGCNKMRNEFNIPYNSKLTIQQAIEIFKKFRTNRHQKLTIIDRDLDEISHSSGTKDEVMLVLMSNHYYIIKGYLRINKCPLCYRIYKKVHNCSLLKYTQCLECGAYHDAEKPCNPTKISYFQSQKLKLRPTLTGSFKPETCANDIMYHYDVETYPDILKVHKPYISGYTDENREFKYFSGENCIEQTLDYFLDLSTKLKKDIYLNAFNGSNFDHRFILQLITDKRDKYKMKKEDLITNNNSILKLKVRNNTSDFGVILYDLKKHLTGSLKSNLEAYKCNVQKGDFDHSKGQSWDLMNPQDQSDCIKYLEGDVIGLQELYNTFNSSINVKFKANIHKYLSTSQLTYAMWQENIKKKYAIYLPKMNVLNQDDSKLNEEEMCRGAIYGGRCYPVKKQYISPQREAYIKKEITFDDITDYLIDLDVVSLYPFAMKHYLYPTGQSYVLTEEEIKSWNTTIKDIQNVVQESKIKLGFKTPLPLSICRIKYKTPKDIAHSVLPRRKNKSLKWDLFDGEGYYTSVDIENAINLGYEIEFISGIYWKQKNPIFEDYISKMFADKEKADKSSPLYQIAKLMMNGLYGKLLQRPIYDEFFNITTVAELWKLYDDYKLLEIDIIGTTMFIKAEKRDIEKLEKKITKPSHLGAFVLAYSRRIMLEYMMKTNPYFKSDDRELQVLNDFYYTDTDAIHVLSKNSIPLGKQLGDISDDLGGYGKILKSIYIAPKLYMLEYVLKMVQGWMNKCKVGKTITGYGKIQEFGYDTDNKIDRLILTNGLVLHRDEDIIQYHHRGKGVSADQLTKEGFETMLQGGSLTTSREFQIQKINIKRNSKQQHLKSFDLLHKSSEETIRVINKIKWSGRQFINENDSIPFS